jgi:Holliday junction resolvase|tara:strand:- start:5853 stop:6185 length:333 start_codon:yes stop_codon:yes gene_type:complete
MTHKNKIRGNNLERECVNIAKGEGLSAERAYASNGLSLGKSEQVDCVVEGYAIQAKRKKKVAQWLYPKYHADDVDVVVTRMDRKEALAIIPYDEWIRLIKIEKENSNENK